MREWGDALMAGGETGDLPAAVPDCADMPEAEDLPRSAAEQAADYARSFPGFEKAADYIAKHFDAETFRPGDIIPVTTRNQALEGQELPQDVSFRRRDVELTDDLTVRGVFPEFGDSHCRVELGEDAKDMTLYQQFSACRDAFQERLFDGSVELSDITLGDMERLEQAQGFAPEGFTWNHDPDVGSFDLVPKKDHCVGHTGGNALWGKAGK